MRITEVQRERLSSLIEARTTVSADLAARNAGQRRPGTVIWFDRPQPFGPTEEHLLVTRLDYLDRQLADTARTLLLSDLLAAADDPERLALTALGRTDTAAVGDADAAVAAWVVLQASAAAPARSPADARPGSGSGGRRRRASA